MNTRTCISDADLARLQADQVSPQQRQRLERHLRDCPDCRRRWDQLCGGARRIERLFGSADPPGSDACPSEELIAAYLGDALDPAEKAQVEAHLAQCASCREMVRWSRGTLASYEDEGEAWWADFVGRQVLGLLARVPQHAEDLLGLLEAETPAVVPSPQIIKLPILETRATASQRLAAATGEGFAEQVLRQDDPPFEFHLVQFGRELRITVRAVGDESPYRECLARFELFEGKIQRFSRILLVEKGEAQCVLSPEDVAALRPQQRELAARLSPLVTLAQLAAAGSDAYRPIFERLLQHPDPQVRRHTVEVCARIYGPEARSLIEPLSEDADEGVRAIARQALDRLQGG